MFLVSRAEKGLSSRTLTLEVAPGDRFLVLRPAIHRQPLRTTQVLAGGGCGQSEMATSSRMKSQQAEQNHAEAPA